MEPYFFLSYARVDDDGSAVGAFYQDLRAELAGRDPEAAAQPAFLDIERIFLGSRWERVLADAVAGCRAMVALYSPAYCESHPITRAVAAGRRLDAEIEPCVI